MLLYFYLCNRLNTFLLSIAVRFYMDSDIPLSSEIRPVSETPAIHNDLLGHQSPEG